MLIGTSVNTQRQGQMLLSEPKIETPDPFSDWRSATQDALRACGTEVAQSLSVGDRAEKLDIEHVKSSPHAHSLKITVSDEQGFLKIFASNTAGTSAYERERSSLCLLKDSGLVPRIRAYSDARKWVLTDWVDVSPETYAVASGSPVAYAYELGQWLARFDGLAPGRPLRNLGAGA